MFSFKRPSMVCNMAVLALLALTTISVHAQTLFYPAWRSPVKLTPGGRAMSISDDGIIVGSTGNAGVIWFGLPPNSYRLLPELLEPWDIDGDQVVTAGGQLYFISTNTWFNLPRGEFLSVSARGVSGGRQVGIGLWPFENSFREHAVMWQASQSDPGGITDLWPVAAKRSSAHDIDGANIVGEKNPTGQYHAYLWNIGSGIEKDLNVPPMLASSASGVWGNQAVGEAYMNLGDGWKWRAVVWNIETGGYTVLQPAGYKESSAQAVRNGWQVGSATKNGSFQHAVIWRGSAGSMVDLHQFLPAGVYKSSIAYGVDSMGNVVGSASTFGSVNHAILWPRGFFHRPKIQ
jgi:hypothetical protein